MDRRLTRPTTEVVADTLAAAWVAGLSDSGNVESKKDIQSSYAALPVLLDIYNYAKSNYLTHTWLIVQCNHLIPSKTAIGLES